MCAIYVLLKRIITLSLQSNFNQPIDHKKKKKRYNKIHNNYVLNLIIPKKI